MSLEGDTGNEDAAVATTETFAPVEEVDVDDETSSDSASSTSSSEEEEELSSFDKAKIRIRVSMLQYCCLTFDCC